MKKYILLLIACLLSAVPAAQGADPAYRLGFSPHGEALQVILQGIAGAKESILVAAFSFTSKPVSKALLAAHKRGVKVSVVADQEANTDKYTALNFLANKGIPVRLNGRYGAMHHKFMVIDESAVQIGSFNYSAAAAEKNAENVLLLKDVPGLAARYAAEWKKLWEEGTDMRRNY